MRRDGMGYEYCDEEYDDIRVEGPKEKMARLFEEEQRAKTKKERERIWMEQQRIYS